MNDTVTVMVEDNWIAVDGVTVWFRNKINLIAGHEKLWALHWKDGKGEYQFDDPPKNFFFKSNKYEQFVQPYVDQWAKEKQEQRDEARAEWYKPENVEARARETRNVLLEETDYILMPDYPITEEQREAWIAYRQALRDLPEQEGWPTDIIWPEKPSL